MADIYHPQVHTFVMVKYPDPKHPGWKDPFEIILHTGERVWIRATYLEVDESVTDVTFVTDSRGPVYDSEGGCLLSIPASWCKYYDDKETESIVMCMEEDAKLLRYAQ
ncbi:hypothetical protein EHM76_04365 [bacterium]|nr:MAG: hypothetical protein EHM76_04365 [bacterium]